MSGSGPSLPKILLAKPPAPGGSVAAKLEDDAAAALRSRIPSIGSLNLNLLSDSWDFHIDRFLPFLTENTEFTVIGVIGPPGVGKSTIMNQLYGFDSSIPGMLPPFGTLSEETRAMAKHSTTGIEPRVSAERLILLDTQPVFSPSVLAEMIRPDGSSTIPVLGNESVSAELAHELMGIQLGVLLCSICHILIIVSEGVHDSRMWQLMTTVDLLKHGIPDPSSLISAHTQNPNVGLDKEYKDKVEEHMATPVFVHTKLHDQEMNPHNGMRIRKALSQFFKSTSFTRDKSKNADSNLFLVPLKNKDEYAGSYESYISMLWRLRDEILSMKGASFTRTVSERDWLRNSAKIWDLVKSSSIIADYGRTLQNSGSFRR